MRGARPEARADVMMTVCIFLYDMEIRKVWERRNCGELSRKNRLTSHPPLTHFAYSGKLYSS